MTEMICFILTFIAGMICATISGEKLKLQRNILRQEVEQLKLQLEAYQKPRPKTLGEKLEELLPDIDGDTLRVVTDDILPIPPICSDRAEDDVSDNWEDNPGW